jgi:hypothetical protein
MISSAIAFKVVGPITPSTDAPTHRWIALAGFPAREFTAITSDGTKWNYQYHLLSAKLYL